MQSKSYRLDGSAKKNNRKRKKEKKSHTYSHIYFNVFLLPVLACSMKIHFLLFASPLTSFKHYYHRGGRLFIYFIQFLCVCVCCCCRCEYVLLSFFFFINAPIKNILSFVDKPSTHMPFDLILSETFQSAHCYAQEI